MPDFGRYYRTLKHLRVAQLTGQFAARWKRMTRDPAKILAGVEDAWRLPASGQSIPLAPPVPDQDARHLAEHNFEFIGLKVQFGSSIDWQAPAQPRLWTYNLHYFDWLWTLLPEHSPDWETARRLTTDWIENHPPARLACGWEPYPISLRLMNWCLLFGQQHRDLVAEDNEFCALLTASVSRQVRWLELNIETHIQANHLLENLAALACVSSILDGPAATRIQERVLPLLRRELAEQVLPDGVHYERSPMYHLRVLWLVEMLTVVGTTEVRSAVQGLPERMRKALGDLRHPDSEIALFNDAAHGVYLDSWKGSDSVIAGPWALPDAGFYGIRYRADTSPEVGTPAVPSGPAAPDAIGLSVVADNLEIYLICKAGPIGPDHQPGHAHADIGNFELSLFGRRVITDTGVPDYTESEARAYARSTRAHNTVEIENEDQAEMWGVFRVGRRPGMVRSKWDPGGDRFRLEVTHDGYKHLSCRALHTRIWNFDSGRRRLRIEDVINTRRPLKSRPLAYFHFHPECEATVDPEASEVMVECPGGKFRFKFSSPSPDCSPPTISLRETSYWSRFNVPQKRASIAIEFDLELVTDILF